MHDLTRRRILFDAGWLFTGGDIAGAAEPDFDDAGWRALNLPHDWSIEGPFDEEHPGGFGGAYLPAGVGWYRKRFRLPEREMLAQTSVEFDGVYKNSDVWLNGHHLGIQPYGYTSFRYDLTPYLCSGGTENVLAVRVNTTQPDTRWYTGSGIYRHVWLAQTGALHVAHWGTYVTTPVVEAEQAWVNVRTRIRNDGPAARDCTLVTTIVDLDSAAVAAARQQHPIAAGQEHEAVQLLRLARPHLWSIDDPYLYRMHSELYDGDQIVDEYDTPLGVRTICFDANQGFLLNGQRVKINGVCLHHDGGCVGAAVPERVLERRLELLKVMGCNGIRSSHYPPAPELLDMCDRMGFVVMDEAFDEWAQARHDYGYHDDFAQWWATDLTSMLQRDRNHPCVVLWSVGNEIPEQDSPAGVMWLRRMVEIVHQEDPTRPVTSACDRIDAPPVAHGPTHPDFLALLDVVGYNYVNRWGELGQLFYSVDRHRFPQRKMIGSENISIGGIRGQYNMTAEAGAWHGPYFAQMIRAELLWKVTRINDYVAGDFMWAGIDYLGEARWPQKSSSSGQLDTCGFPKDGYYFYQSQWTEQPMLHLFPHWNWPGDEGRVIPVLCYTNCDSVELFVNDTSWGAKSFRFAYQGFDRTKGWDEQSHAPDIWPVTADLHLSWDVPYQPGTLRAVGSKDGAVVCVQEIVTAGPPAQIDLAVDRAAIAADDRDVVHVTARILDQDGNLVPTAGNVVTFAIDGPGRLIGVDNGNPASHEAYQVNSRAAFNGLCLAIVQSSQSSGTLRITAKSPGMSTQSVTVEVVAG